MTANQIRGFPRSSAIALLVGVIGTILNIIQRNFYPASISFSATRRCARVRLLLRALVSVDTRKSLAAEPGDFHPRKRTLAYSDLLFGSAAPYSFFRMLGFGMFTSTEFIIILFTFLAIALRLFCCTERWDLASYLRVRVRCSSRSIVRNLISSRTSNCNTSFCCRSSSRS